MNLVLVLKHVRLAFVIPHVQIFTDIWLELLIRYGMDRLTIYLDLKGFLASIYANDE